MLRWVCASLDVPDRSRVVLRPCNGSELIQHASSLGGCGDRGWRQCRPVCGAGGRRARRLRARARARAGGRGRRQQPLHGRRHALRLRRRRRPEGPDARPDRAGDRPDRLRHLYRGPVLRRHVPRHRVPHRPGAGRGAGEAEPRRRCAGCGARACASRRSGAGRRSRSTAGSSSGAASPSRATAAGRASSPRSRRPPRRTASPCSTTPGPWASSPTTMACRACACATAARTGSVATRNVVLAAGGFQANAEWRTRYMGPGWELAKVRGTRFNTGDGIKMALDANAMPTGNWSGGHAVAWDRNAPEFGDLSVGDNFQKHNYPVQHHDQRQRRALRRRGRRLPQLHLRQVRPRDPDAAGAILLAGVRQEGAAPPARRIPHQAHHQGVGQHAARARARSSTASMPPRRSRPSRPSTRR